MWDHESILFLVHYSFILICKFEKRNLLLFHHYSLVLFIESSRFKLFVLCHDLFCFCFIFFPSSSVEYEFTPEAEILSGYFVYVNLISLFVCKGGFTVSV